MNSPSNNRLKEFTQGILLAGVLLVLLGIAAIVAAIQRPSFIGILLSSLFLVAGGARLVYSWQTRSEKGFRLKVSTGVLYLMASFLLFTAILQRYIELSTLVGVVMLLQGGLELLLARQLQPGKTRQWFWAMGLGALLLGGFFVSSLRITLAWLLGLIAALSLILPGGWLIFLASSMQAEDA
ncbi:MAG: hypothetical protein F6K00_06050 [Leptolyngbya sp. SIOISBB]|nr:hypothetical protein [Leptolyngbya sp. SIOISBB]